MPAWVTKNDWLLDAVKQLYKELHPVQVLVIANFDESAVSDGTAGCHFKDEAFVYASNAVRRNLGPRLDTVLQTIGMCNDIVAHLLNHDYELPEKAQMAFGYAIPALIKASEATDQDTISLLSDCIDLSSADVWVDTVYGNGIQVRARGNVSGKEQKETTIQARLIEGAKKRHL
jgi:hypothetical protein